MSISAGQVHVDLGARLDRGEFEKYERELKKVQERVARKEHFKAQLGGDFDARAFNSYERELKKAEHANDNMIRSQGRLRTSFGSVWAKGGAAFAAAGGAFAVVTAVKSVTAAYADSEVSQRKMAAQLKALGINYDAHAEQIDKVIQRTSKLAGLDDEDLQDAFTAIVRTTKSVNTGLKDMSIVADLARAKHMDVAKAGEFLAKIHAGNVGGLRRLGIEFVKTTDHVDALKKAHKTYTPAQLAAAKAEDQHANSTRALGLLQDRVKGQAASYGKTQAGAMDRVKVAFENVQETLGAKLAPTLTRAANGLAKFVNEMDAGTGKGGQFVDLLKAIGRGFTLFARAVRTVAGVVAGFFEGMIRGFQLVGEAGSHLPGVGGKFKRLAEDADRAADKIHDFKKRMNLSVEAGKVNDDLERMRKKTGSSMTDIRRSVREGMKVVKDRLGTDTQQGRDALARHFRSMVARIREAMSDGKVETKDGLAQIRSVMLTELKELGIPVAQAKGKPLSSHAPKDGKVPVVKAGGGWIGGPGVVGHDTVPAMLAPGEAVLNRHQQGVIEAMLGEGFLDQLFARVQKPHYLARGGRVRFAYGGVTPAIESLIQDLDSKGFHHGSTTGPGHAPGGYHPRGMAVDYGDASNDMQRLWSVVFPQRQRFAELFGPSRVNPGPHLMHNGSGFTNAGLQAQHQDHIHMALAAAIGALGSGGAALGAVWKAIRSPQTALTGLLGDVVQGTLTKTTAAANRRGRSLAATVGGLPGAGVSGGGGNAANQALGRRLLSSFGFGADQWPPLKSLWTGESGWSTTASNQSSGAYGIPQALPGSKMASAGSDWQTNPATQIRWGLGYIKDRYGSPSGAYSAWLSRSPHWYAKGKPGKPSKLVRTVGGHTAGLMRKIRPVQTDRSERFDALMARVETADQNYSRWERRFNISDEELVDADTGQINVSAIKRKAKELGQLILIRAGMERDLEMARDIAKAAVQSYRKIVNALRKSLRHATKKNRKGIRSYISQYEPRIAEWQGKVGEIGGSLFDARSDVLELKGELKDVLGTVPNIPTPDALDTPDIPDVADTSTGAGTADSTPTAPTPLQIAEAASQEMRSFLAGRQDLLSSFGRNYVPASQAAGTFGAPDALTAAAGVRAFGAASSGGLGGATIINNYNQLPANTQTWAEQMRFVVGG